MCHYPVYNTQVMFKGLGEKKLELLQQYDEPNKKPSFDDLLNIDGYSEISAQSYLDAIDSFWEFASQLPGLKYKEIKIAKDRIYQGKTLVFTGFRDGELEEKVKSQGGKIGSSVSKKTFALVVKSKGSGSSKEKKAIDLGIEVMTKDDLEIKLDQLVEQNKLVHDDSLQSSETDLIQPDLF